MKNTVKLEEGDELIRLFECSELGALSYIALLKCSHGFFVTVCQDLHGPFENIFEAFKVISELFSSEIKLHDKNFQAFKKILKNWHYT